ncbi:MAG: hypothetical protein H7Z73_04795, partial [Candidatus Saccharibacteria bacterium]|nr:hypothetical protein [Moraxellaceae bacterium]
MKPYSYLPLTQLEFTEKIAMTKFKLKLAKLVQKSKPLWATYSFFRAIYLFIFRPNRIKTVIDPAFHGWGLTSITSPPWNGGGTNSLAQNFSRADALLKTLVQDKKFVLSQFKHMSAADEMKFLGELNWRHYMVYWSSAYAVKNTESAIKNFAECGVCDGLTIFYAITAAKDLNQQYAAYLYDAWDGLREDLLLESEKYSAGNYAYLNVASTQNNLRIFDANTLFFNKGYIPESFDAANNPTKIVWLHIDLNGALPTVC